MPGALFHVFLSHNSDDKPAVEELARRLKADGLEGWLDKWHLIPGQAWQQAIEQALADSGSVAVFVGPSGFGPWQNEEMRVALAKRVKDGDGKFRVIPVLLPGGTREERGRLPAFLLELTWVEFRDSLDDADAYHRLKSGILGLSPGLPTGQSVFEGQCPYRGLSAFQSEHAKFYFGREARIEWILNELRPSKYRDNTGAPLVNRFVAIVGDSGSGKSSLARAGLVHALQQGKLEGSEDWPIIICRPGQNPLESLAVELCGHPKIKSSIGDVGDLIAHMATDETRLHLAIRVALAGAAESQRVVLLIDQFEEVFSLHADNSTNPRSSGTFSDGEKSKDAEAARNAFINNLVHAAGIAGGKAIVILTMRADFYSKCASYPRLAAIITEHQELVGPLTRTELREVIERPAQLVGLELQPGLTEMLLTEMESQPGALPLLQHALRELWQRRDGHQLTIAAYNAIGGLEGALEQQANAAFDAMSPAQQETCRRIFLRLTQPGEGTEDTKRRVHLNQLGDSNEITPIINRLTEVRLITAEKGSFVEVAHEALIRSWTKLRGWIESERESMRTQHRLTEAAAEWNTAGRDSGYLYQGARLAEAEEWSKIPESDLTREEREFLAASIDQRDREKREEINRQKREIETLTKLAGIEKQRAGEQAASARRSKWQSIFAMTLAVAALIASAFAWKAQKQAKLARQQVEQTYANDLLARISGHPGDLEQNEIDAFWQIASLKESQQALREKLSRQSFETTNVERLINRAPFVARAVVGLDNKRRTALKLKILELLNNSDPSSEDPGDKKNRKLAAARVGVALNLKDDVFTEAAVESLSLNMADCHDPKLLKSLKDDLSTVMGSISQDRLHLAVEQVIKAIETSSEAENVTALCNTILEITNLPLSQVETRRIGSRLLPLMNQTTGDPRVFVGLVKCMTSLPEHLAENFNVKNGVGFIVDTMAEYPSREIRDTLFGVYESGVKRANPVQREIAANQILSRMKPECDSDEMHFLAKCLAVVAQQIPSKGVDLILQGMNATTNAQSLKRLFEGLKQQGNVTEEDCRKALSRLLEVIQQEELPPSLMVLAKCLKEIPDKIPEKEMGLVKEKLLTRMKTYDTPPGMLNLSFGLASLPDTLSRQDSERAFAILLGWLDEVSETELVKMLGDAMKSLGTNLSDDGAEAGASMILSHVENTVDARKLIAMANGLQGMKEVINSKAIDKSFMILMTKLRSAKLPIDVANVVESLSRIPGQLSEMIADEMLERMLSFLLEKETEQSLQVAVSRFELACRVASPHKRQEAIGRILKKFHAVNETWMKRELSHGLALVCDAVKADQEFEATEISPIADCLVSAMQRAISPDEIKQLAKGLQKVGPLLSEKRGHATAQQIIDLIPYWIQATNDPNAVGQIAQLWSAMAKRMKPEQVDAACKYILEVTDRDGNKETRPALCHAAVNLANAIQDDYASEGLTSLLEGLQRVHEYETRSILLQGIERQATRIPANNLRRAKKRMLAATKTHIDEQVSIGLINALKKLPEALDTPEMIEMLKSPFCTPAATEELLRMIEDKNRLQPVDNVWMLMDSVKGTEIKPQEWQKPPEHPNDLGVDSAS